MTTFDEFIELMLRGRRLLTVLYKRMHETAQSGYMCALEDYANLAEMDVTELSEDDKKQAIMDAILNEYTDKESG